MQKPLEEKDITNLKGYCMTEVVGRKGKGDNIIIL